MADRVVVGQPDGGLDFERLREQLVLEDGSQRFDERLLDVERAVTRRAIGVEQQVLGAHGVLHRCLALFPVLNTRRDREGARRKLEQLPRQLRTGNLQSIDDPRLCRGVDPGQRCRRCASRTKQVERRAPGGDCGRVRAGRAVRAGDDVDRLEEAALDALILELTVVVVTAVVVEHHPLEVGTEITVELGDRVVRRAVVDADEVPVIGVGTAE